MTPHCAHITNACTQVLLRITSTNDVMFSSALVSKLVSDVNKDWTCKDKDKDQAYNDQERERRERILFATALQAYQKGYKPI